MVFCQFELSIYIGKAMYYIIKFNYLIRILLLATLKKSWKPMKYNSVFTLIFTIKFVTDQLYTQGLQPVNRIFVNKVAQKSYRTNWKSLKSTFQRAIWIVCKTFFQIIYYVCEQFFLIASNHVCPKRDTRKPIPNEEIILRTVFNFPQVWFLLILSFFLLRNA